VPKGNSTRAANVKPPRTMDVEEYKRKLQTDLAQVDKEWAELNQRMEELRPVLYSARQAWETYQGVNSETKPMASDNIPSSGRY
jgi:hypothetical protein